MVYIVRKQIGGSLLTINECMAALDTGQLDSVEAWFAEYGETQTIHDAIRKLRVYQSFTSDGSGIVTFPDDYLHLFGVPYTIYGSTPTQLAFVQEDEFATAMSSQLRAVTNEYPIAVDNNNGFTIFPTQTQIGFYWYLRRPATPLLAYTQVGRVITYNAGGSTQLEFSDAYINNIIARALIYIGINLSEREIAAFAAAYNEETK